MPRHSRMAIQQLDVPDVVQETDIEDLSDSSLDNKKVEDAEYNRTQRMLKREKLRGSSTSGAGSDIKLEEEEELKNLSMLEDGMTKQMKLDLLKALAASRESAAAEISTRNQDWQLRNETEILADRASSSHQESPIVENLSNNPTDVIRALIDSPPFDSPLLFDVTQPEVSDKHLKNEPEEWPEPTAGNVNEERVLVDKRKFKETGPVPPFFAPNGVDPDAYSQVIFKELTRYHKNFHALQRQSLHPSEWGAPVVASGLLTTNQQQVATVKRTVYSNWLLARQQNNSQLSDFDERFFEIESSSETSSHEEFVVGSRTKTSKNSRKTVKRSTNKKRDSNEKFESDSKAQQQGFQQRTYQQSKIHEDVAGEDELPSFNTVAKSSSLSLKRRGVQLLDPANTTTAKKTKSIDTIRLTEDFTLEDPVKNVGTNAVGGRDTQETSVVLNSQPEEESKVTCPLCAKRFDVDVVEEHASDCLGTSENEDDDQPTAIPSNSKPRGINFINTRCCYVCGEQFALDVIDRHLVFCSLKDTKSKQPNPDPRQECFQESRMTQF